MSPSDGCGDHQAVEAGRFSHALVVGDDPVEVVSEGEGCSQVDGIERSHGGRLQRPGALVGVGVEPHQEWADVARGRGYDLVIEGLMPEALRSLDETFDCLVFNDVLEHMVDPWSTLRESRSWVAPGGSVVASIPSIEYLPVLYRLVRRSRWDYVDEGTLDRTHLRFFTRQTMVEMFEGAGYEVQSVVGIHSALQEHERWRRLRLLAPLIGDRQWLQFVVVARPTAGR